MGMMNVEFIVPILFSVHPINRSPFHFICSLFVCSTVLYKFYPRQYEIRH
jgi:hypothetical protein